MCASALVTVVAWRLRMPGLCSVRMYNACSAPCSCRTRSDLLHNLYAGRNPTILLDTTYPNASAAPASHPHITYICLNSFYIICVCTHIIVHALCAYMYAHIRTHTYTYIGYLMCILYRETLRHSVLMDWINERLAPKPPSPPRPQCDGVGLCTRVRL